MCPRWVGTTASATAARSQPCPKKGRQPAMDIIKIIFAILLPPVGVFLEVGLGLHFWLNILLTILGYLPGIIHAIFIIATR